MAVRLFVGNLSYATTEADLRAYFGAVAPPSQVVLPVDRETGRPRGFAFVEFADRGHAVPTIFMSGYTGDTVVRYGLLDLVEGFLDKPFAPQLLLEKVRSALDAHPRQ